MVDRSLSTVEHATTTFSYGRVLNLSARGVCIHLASYIVVVLLSPHSSTSMNRFPAGFAV
jgi:hypothetical protein